MFRSCSFLFPVRLINPHRQCMHFATFWKPQEASAGFFCFGGLVQKYPFLFCCICEYNDWSILNLSKYQSEALRIVPRGMAAWWAPTRRRGDGKRMTCVWQRIYCYKNERPHFLNISLSPNLLETCQKMGLDGRDIQNCEETGSDFILPCVNQVKYFALHPNDIPSVLLSREDTKEQRHRLKTTTDGIQRLWFEKVTLSVYVIPVGAPHMRHLLCCIKIILVMYIYNSLGWQSVNVLYTSVRGISRILVQAHLTKKRGWFRKACHISCNAHFKHKLGKTSVKGGKLV